MNAQETFEQRKKEALELLQKLTQSVESDIATPTWKDTAWIGIILLDLKQVGKCLMVERNDTD